MKKLFWLIIGIVLSYSVCVNALEYQDRFDEVKYINDYVVKMKDGRGKYQQMTMMERLSDGKFVYCIEPGIAIDSDNLMVGSDMNQSEFASISKDKWKRISLLAYYGYGYENHTNIKWYTITQFMIWQTVNNGYDIYFTDTLNGKRITKYTSEMKEMEELLAKHDILPNFNLDTVSLKLGEGVTIVDSNNILDYYDISSSDLVNIQKSSNSLTFNAIKDGNSSITLTKKDKSLEHPAIVYVDPASQDILVRGSYDEVNVNLNIEVKGAKVKVTKIDKVTKEVISLSGIKFKIKNLDTGEYLCQNTSCEYETNDDGYFVTPGVVSVGRYSLEEVKQKIHGYLWNFEPIEFVIDSNSNFVNTPDGLILDITFANDPVKTLVNVEKLGEEVVIENGSFSYKEVLLDGVKFDLYAGSDILKNGKVLYKKNQLIRSFSTVDGKFQIENLPLGKYYIVENETVLGHVLDSEKHYFELNYIDEVTPVVSTSLTLKNHLSKGTLEFYKVDSETQEGLSDTRIEIYTSDDELIYSGVTDSEGKIVLDNLFLGKFYIVEVSPKDGYQLSNERQEFELIENKKTVTVTRTNDKIIVPVPKTDSYDYLSRSSVILFIIGIIGTTYENVFGKKKTL